MKTNDTLLDRIHRVEVEILDEIVRICEAHHLRYYLIGGTLLGAIRHHGFIPWDEDLDIVMPRKDYETLLRLCDTQLNSAFYLQCHLTEPDYWLPFAKIRKKNTLFLESHAPAGFPIEKQGIFVDIFPLDDAKKQQGFQGVQWKMLRLCRVLQDAKQNGRQAPAFYRFLSGFFSNQKLLFLQQWVMTLANGESKPFYVNFGSQYGIKKQTIAKEKYVPPVKVDFEGKQYNGLRDWDFFLRRLYGDSYMEIPSLEKRASYPSHPVKRLSFDLTNPDETFESLLL